jgi:predicted PurR-regulated permease PerM
MLMTVATVTAVGLLLALVWVGIEVLLIIFAGILLATLLRSLAELLADYTPMSTGWSLLIVIVSLIGAIALGGRLLAPQVTEQVEQLIGAIPASLEQLEAYIEQLPWGPEILNLQPGQQDLFADGGFSVVQQATGFASTTVGILVEIFVLLFLGVYLAISPGKYVRGIVALVPITKRPRAEEVLGAVGYTLKRWLLSRLIAMIVVGIVTTVGLMLLDVPLALVFGILTTILTFVPYVGPIVAALLPALVALAESPTLALYVILLFVVIQNLEGYVLTPLLQQGIVSVPPALTIISEVLFGIMFGVIGIILATPFVAVAVVLVKMLYIEDTLGDNVAVQGEDKNKPARATSRPERARPQPES